MTKTKNPKKEKLKLVGIVGDYTWHELKDILIRELSKCETEEDLLEFFRRLFRGLGTLEDLQRLREDLNIHPFTEKDEKKLKGISKNEN